MANYYPMLKYAGEGGGGSLDGNAEPSDVVSGKTFYSDNANNKETGTMTSYLSGSTQLSFGSSTTMANGFYGDDKNYIAPDLASATSSADAVSDSIIQGRSGYAKGIYYKGNFDESEIMDYNGANSDIFASLKNDNLTVNNTSGNTIFNIKTNRDSICSYGMRYWKKGVNSGTLVADSSHKIYIPRGSVFLMSCNGYNYVTGKYIGVKAYTITTNGGASSTTALAVPKVQQVISNGDPVKLTIGADQLGPEDYYTGGRDTYYAGYIIIGSCGTACRVEYNITPLLTQLPMFNINDFNR